MYLHLKRYLRHPCVPSLPSTKNRHILSPACPCHGQEHHKSTKNTALYPTDSTLYCPLRLHQLHRLPTVQTYKDACSFSCPSNPGQQPPSPAKIISNHRHHQLLPPPPPSTNKSQLTSIYTLYSYSTTIFTESPRSLQHTHYTRIRYINRLHRITQNLQPTPRRELQTQVPEHCGAATERASERAHHLQATTKGLSPHRWPPWRPAQDYDGRTPRKAHLCASSL